METDIINPNAVGFCWLAGGTIGVVIWWNEGGYTGEYDEYGKEIYGCMQAQICITRKLSKEGDINHIISWGHSIDLSIASNLIHMYGAWIKPEKLQWRPRKESTGPLKLKIKFKNQTFS